MEYKNYKTKIKYISAMVIDEKLRAGLIELGYINPPIGDYLINGSTVMRKETFENMYEEI